MTLMAPAPAAARPPTALWLRLAAAAGLAGALLLSRFAFRHRVRIVHLLQYLPAAHPTRVHDLYDAVQDAAPQWWPGRIACMETSLATVLATALTGRRAYWAFGFRFNPHAAHAWVETEDGTAVGRDIGDAHDRPWTRICALP